MLNKPFDRINFSITVIYAGFFGWGGPIFEGRNEILLLDKALKCRVIFQKYGLKLNKICKIIEKIREKCKIFRFFLIFGQD